MKIQERNSVEFQPITFSITLESLEELNWFYFLFNCPVIYGSIRTIGEEAEEIRRNLEKLHPYAYDSIKHDFFVDYIKKHLKAG